MAGRRRLDQVDAMRPIKQAGVVSTHTLIAFAPTAANVGSNAALLLLHVSREAFFFISACMLTYAYADLNRAGLRRFYWRRFVAVGLPYLCWNAIYFLWFLYGLRTSSYASPATALAHFGRQLEIGYDQLYFLLVIMQFYLVFPLVLALLRRTRGHHGLVVAVAVLAQFATAIAMHWNLLPAVLVKYGQENGFCYLLYLIGGAVVACHLSEVHDWVCRHATLVVFLTLLAAFAAEGVYFLARAGVTTALGQGSDPFQPSVIPFNVGALACGYLAGMALVRPWRSRRVKAAVRVGADDAYGIYLSQMLFITTLAALGWRQLGSGATWPLFCLLTVGIVYACSIALTALLARTPLAVPLTGRHQQPWQTLLPRRAAPAPVAPPPPPAPGPRETASTTLAATAGDQNGA